MTKLTKKLMISVLSLAFAIVALGTTTFAWFTMNSQASGTISATVNGGEGGILVSADGQVFASSAEFTTGSARFTPLTMSADGTLKDLDQASASSTQYLQFDVYLTGNSEEPQAFKFDTATGANSVVNSTIGGVPTYTTLKTFGSGDNEVTALSKIKVDAVNALRSTYTVAGSQIDLTDAQAAANKSGVDALFDVPGTVNSQIFGFKGTGDTYSKTAYVSEGAYDFGQNYLDTNAANSYLKAVNGANAFEGKQELDTTYADKDVVEGYANSAEDTFFKTQSGKVTKITFTVWVEGYDADCFDAIMKQTVDFTIGFAVAS